VVTSLEDSLLVDDGVDSDGGLAGLSITNDELTLSTANRHERVDSLEASLHRLVHGFPRDNARRLQLNSGTLGGVDGTLTVDRVTERVDDAAEKFVTDGHIDDRAGPLDDIAFLDLSTRCKKKKRLVTAIVRSHSTYLSLPKMTIPTLSVSKLRAIPLAPDLNSTISPAWTLVRPKTLAIPSPMEMTEPNSLRSFY